MLSHKQKTTNLEVTAELLSHRQCPVGWKYMPCGSTLSPLFVIWLYAGMDVHRNSLCKVILRFVWWCVFFYFPFFPFLVTKVIKELFFFLICKHQYFSPLHLCDSASRTW